MAWSSPPAGSVARLLALPLADVARLGEAAARVFAVEAGLRWLSPGATFRLIAGAARPRRRKGLDLGRLAWLVEVADRHVPGRSSCLRRALGLAWMLGRRGIRADVRIGVARAGGVLEAHAWLETRDGVAIGRPGGTDYAPLPLVTGSRAGVAAACPEP